jgi:Chorismate synthase
MNTFGKNYRISIFGESHGACVGATLDGVPAGLELDFNLIKSESARRAPGQNEFSTPRTEADEWQILSGVLDGIATGAPLTAIIENKNTRSGDYKTEFLRPGHADISAYHKFEGKSDMRGGGQFSGRLTAPLVFAGAIAKQILSTYGITITSEIKDEAALKERTLAAKEQHDSVGGIITCTAAGVPPGLGEPFFDSFESVLSHLLFSVPAVKGIEFGTGFALANMPGSTANDSLYYDGGTIKSRTNHNGGVQGGITTGAADIVFSTVIKPTPSIGIEQDTVNTNTKENVKHTITGRHDPCIVFRAKPVIEACAAIVLLDFIFNN